MISSYFLQTNHNPHPIVHLSGRGMGIYCQFKVLDSKVYRANMGPILGWQDPGGPHVGPMNFAFWGMFNVLHLQ